MPTDLSSFPSDRNFGPQRPRSDRFESNPQSSDRIIQSDVNSRYTTTTGEMISVSVVPSSLLRLNKHKVAVEEEEIDVLKEQIHKYQEYQQQEGK